MIPEPILVVASPRSGTSMTAGLIHRHGVWVGTYRENDKYNPQGHYENKPLNSVLRHWFGVLPVTGEIATPVDGFREKVEEVIRGDGYEEGPWLYKHSVMYWPIWHEFDPIWIKCWRDKESIIASNKAVGFLKSSESDNRVRHLVERHHEEMRKLPGPDVDTEAVAQGDFTTLEEAINHCGLKFDEQIASEFVMPDAWHY